MVAGFGEAESLVLRTALDFILFYLPAFAAAAAVWKHFGRNPILAGVAALAGTGVCAEIVFWMWFGVPRAGRFVSLLIPIVSLVYLVAFVPRLGRSGRTLLRQTLVPVLLSGAYSLLVLGVGFAYGGQDRPFETAWTRFSHPLPPDNTIPFIFAEGVWNHHIQKPMLGDWRSSDRPPLQAGIVLIDNRFYSHDRKFSSELTGVLAQSTWILALWLMLLALEIDSPAIALVLAACLSSGFVLVNTFFVWPKLLAAAYTLGALALLFGRRPPAATSQWAAAMCGVLIALAMLSHGGAIFAFIGAAVTLPLLRIRIPLKHIVVLFGAAFLFYAPWLCYQKFYDPPGDRLLKLHLAGVEKVDPRPFFQALVEAYKSKTPQQIWEYKRSNWGMATDHMEEYWKTLADLCRAIWNRDAAHSTLKAASLRVLEFFFFLPTLGFIASGVPLLAAGVAKRFRTQYWRVALALSVFILITIVIWCLLMFGPASAVLHQGNYATVLLGFAVCCLSLWSIGPKLAQAIVGLQAALNVLLYTVLMRKQTPDHQFVAFGDLDIPMLVITATATLAVVALLFLTAKQNPNAALPYCKSDETCGELLGQNMVH